MSLMFGKAYNCLIASNSPKLSNLKTEFIEFLQLCNILSSLKYKDCKDILILRKLENSH